MKYVLVTTIQQPTPSLIAMAEKAGERGMSTLVIGDRKTPDCSWPEGIEFHSIDAQMRANFALARELPENHYSRKNLGYLTLIARGAEAIFDTDDDNAPLEHWTERSMECVAETINSPGWVNVYSFFTSDQIWPRGLPLQNIRDVAHPEISEARHVISPIQQGLVNGSPDVDAVWRLVMDADTTFHEHQSIALAVNCWSPFNSQSTWWFPEAFPLLYLPSYVTFRMTDIWRSFVAQRCLWQLGRQITFHAPDMYQDRNPHNLMTDFQQEIPGYLYNDKIRDLLQQLPLSSAKSAVGHNMRACYLTLVQEGIIPSEEMQLVDAWLNDINRNQVS